MISSLITQIQNQEIVLPAIQRNFVWEESRISKLFDSVMRGYPLGIVLLWETYLDIKYREFQREYQSGSKLNFKDNVNNKRLKLVLDGQQRLQSLFIAINGTLNGKELYFDVLSGKSADDFREVLYVFRFLKNERADKLNEETKARLRSLSESDDNGDQEKYSLFLPIKNILTSSPEDRLRLKNYLKNSYNLADGDIFRLELNMNKLIHSITNDNNILKISTIDENKPRESTDRKSESDILEAFVRINRQGITLSRSDLIFSMLKLNWKESAEELPDFIRDINDGNNLGIDIDFVIRSLFSVSNLGSKFDVDLLRKYSNIENIKQYYMRTCDAIKSLVDFLRDDCNILNSAIIGGYLNLIPIVYFLANTPNNLVPDKEIGKLKKALYLFGFTKPFSRYADSRIAKFIREELKPLADTADDSFPLNESIWWCNYWEGYDCFDTKLLQKNKYLTLHLLQGRSGNKVKYERNAPEIDHIFPQSVLKEKDYDLSMINSLGNYWILAKTKNQKKSKKHPSEYFRLVDESVLKMAIIDPDMLNYRQVTTFIKTREQKILDAIKRKLGVKSDELDYSSIWSDKNDE